MNVFEHIHGAVTIDIEYQVEVGEMTPDSHAGELTTTSDTIQHFPAVINDRKFTVLIIEHTP